MMDNLYFMLGVISGIWFFFGLALIVQSLIYTAPRMQALYSNIYWGIYSFVGDVINRINLRVYVNLDLAPSSSQIRLVHILPGPYHARIKCRLVPGNWRTSSYEALSYTWGNAVLVRQIDINERLFLIPGNLHTALRSLRHEEEERAVWIDALSINQRDELEREHQVQQMRQIYANASKVLVSMGESTEDIALAFDYIKGWSKGKLPRRRILAVPKAIIVIPDTDYHLTSKRGYRRNPQKDPLSATRWQYVSDMEHMACQPWQWQPLSTGPLMAAPTATDYLRDIDYLAYKRWSDGDRPTSPTLAVPKVTDHIRNPNYQTFATPERNRFQKVTRAAAATLLGCSWWERMWVIQEVAVAKEIEIICGPNSIQWEMFCKFVTREHLRPDEDDDFGHAVLKFLSRGLPELQALPTLQYGLLDLCHEFRSRHATDPRDKLYALLGLIANEEDRGLIPDYSKPVHDVYMDFVKSHISQYQSVAVLSFAEYRGNQFLIPLPSWCPNWTVEALSPAPLWKKAPSDQDMWLHETRDIYYAAGSSKAFLLPHPNASILCVRGFVFDFILAIGNIATVPYEGQAKKRRAQRHWYEPEDFEAIRQAEEAETYRFTTRRRNKLFTHPRAKVAQWEWEDLAFAPWDRRITQHSPYADGSERTDAYYQTITAGVSGQKHIDWRFMEHDFFHKNDFPGKVEACRVINLACMGRRFFITRRGYMGLAPGTAQKGDLVSVLLGGNIPFILRKTGQNHHVVGQTYAHGIMAYDDDQMEADIRKRRINLQDFLLI